MKKEPCNKCNATGGDSHQSCRYCDGRGYITIETFEFEFKPNENSTIVFHIDAENKNKAQLLLIEELQRKDYINFTKRF